MSAAAKFGLVKTTSAGRALIALQDISPSELIFSDVSSVVAPITHSQDLEKSIFCVACFKSLKKCDITCSKCHLPVCDETCSLGPDHAEDCKQLYSIKVEDNDDSSKRFLSLVPCIGAIRLIAQKRLGGEINQLISDRDESFVLPDWEEHIVKTLTSENKGQGSSYTRNDVFEALGIFATNGVKVRRSKLYSQCVALFPTFSMANHSCICSAMYDSKFMNSGTFRIDLRAQTQIKKGCQISIRYIDSLQTTSQRKKACKEKWNFVCNCPRCFDPTERKTFSSGILCSECKTSQGTLLPKYESQESLIPNWTCDICKVSVDDTTIENDILKPLVESKTKLMSLSSGDDNSDDEDSDEEASDNDETSDDETSDDETDFSEELEGVGLIEGWIWNASKILHSNHASILEMEFHLVVAYSRLVEDILSAEKSSRPKLRPIRERIVQLTMHLLEVFAKLDPGSTRVRGMLMQKLVQPWMEIAKSDSDCGAISVEQFKQRVFFGMLTAKEAVQCLKVY